MAASAHRLEPDEDVGVSTVPEPYESRRLHACRDLVRLVQRRAELRGVGIGSVLDECVRWNV